jgi:hypothetical protein
MGLRTSRRSGVSTRAITVVVILLVTGAALVGYFATSRPSSSGRTSSSSAGPGPTSTTTESTTMTSTTASTTRSSTTSSTTAGSFSHFTVFSKQNESSQGDDSYPTWSPDGSKLLFLRLTKGNGPLGVGNESLWVLYLNGTERGPLLQVNTSATLITGASWSPDGGSIVLGTAAYTSPYGALEPISSGQLVSINVKTSSVRTIATIMNASIIDPIQLADGSIVFLSGDTADASGNTLLSLDVISANGTRPTQLVGRSNNFIDTVISYCASSAGDKVAVLFGFVFWTNGTGQSRTNMSVIEFPSRAMTTFGWYNEQAFCSWSGDGRSIFTYSFSGSETKVNFATADASGSNKLLFGGQQLIARAPAPQSVFALPMC